MSFPIARVARVAASSVLVCSGLVAAPWAVAQPAALPTTLSVRPAQVKLNLERVKLPAGENMGLLGTSYLVGVGSDWWLGPAAYGAISGQRGGLFTVGLEALRNVYLGERMGLDLGLYVGGGGGGAAPVGGGLMLRPHADLWWAVGDADRVGLSLSQVRFSGGAIQSTQLGVVWSHGLGFRYVPGDRLAATGPVGAGRSGVGFDRVRITAGVYHPRGDRLRVSGNPLPASIGTVGMRLERTLSPYTYWGIEAAGAARGGVAGYAEYLGTLGAEVPVGSERLRLGGRVALGMGGGGDVPTGGGLLLKAALHGTVRLSPALGLTLEAGVTRAPQGSFEARHASAALNWHFDAPRPDGTPAPATRTEWAAGIERYNAVRQDGSTRALQGVTLRLNRFVTPNLYLSGQARSAYGGGAGGYSVGLIGVGVQAPLAGRWHAGAEALVGAAGGGGVDSTGGAIAQPTAYVGYDITPAVALRVGVGRIKSLQNGPLDSTVVEAAVSFSYGVLSHGR